MRVVLGGDHAGFGLKGQICRHLRKQGIVCVDFGTFCENVVDYPDLAYAVAQAVAAAEFTAGILICGTGVGMSIAANRFPGIRAALCADLYTARLAREHNDANILVLGARVIGTGLGTAMADLFLKTSFRGGHHNRRLKKIEQMPGSW